MISEYVVQVGATTEQDAKLALSTYFLDRFTRAGVFDYGHSKDEEPWYLAASAAMNVVFGEIDLRTPAKEYWRSRRGSERALARDYIPEDTVQFASKNGEQIETEVNGLAADHALCSILSGAAYNVSYGRYFKAGGKRGIFSNDFITYVRSLFRLECTELILKLSEKIDDLDQWILRPLDAMMRYGILRRFPNNPNEREYLQAVQGFAARMQKLKIETPDERRSNTAYPTEKQMDELISALESDDPAAIRGVLEKRRVERQQQLAAEDLGRNASTDAATRTGRIK